MSGNMVATSRMLHYNVLKLDTIGHRETELVVVVCILCQRADLAKLCQQSGDYLGPDHLEEVG